MARLTMRELLAGEGLVFSGKASTTVQESGRKYSVKSVLLDGATAEQTAEQLGHAKSCTITEPAVVTDVGVSQNADVKGGELAARTCGAMDGACVAGMHASP